MSAAVQLLSLISGTACFIYYLVIINYAGVTADFAWIWPAGAGFLFFLAVTGKAAVLHPHPFLTAAVRIEEVILLLAMAAGLFLGCRIVAGMRTNPQQNLEYVIVLGAQVKGKTVSRALKKRLDQALEYGRENPDTIFILSGGKGDGEEITEAEAMEKYMLDAGLPETRIIQEDRSTSTEENLRFCAELMQGKEINLYEREVGILSNNFHVYRAGRLAYRQGYKKVSLIPAPSDPVMQIHYVVREMFAVLFGVMKGSMTV